MTTTTNKCVAPPQKAFQHLQPGQTGQTDIQRDDRRQILRVAAKPPSQNR